MRKMDRKEFIIKSCRWAAGAGALLFAGSLISCTNAGEDTTTTTSSGTSGDSTTGSSGSSGSDGSRSGGSASVAVVSSGRCIGCGRCARGVCPTDAISIIGDLAVIGASCNGCGRCISYCPRSAIRLSSAISSSGGPTGSHVAAVPAGTAAA